MAPADGFGLESDHSVTLDHFTRVCASQLLTDTLPMVDPLALHLHALHPVPYRIVVTIRLFVVRVRFCSFAINPPFVKPPPAPWRAETP